MNNLLWYLLFVTVKVASAKMIMTTDELENHINPEDLNELLHLQDVTTTSRTPDKVDYADIQGTTTKLPVPDTVDCFGLEALQDQFRFFNMKPASSDRVNTHFYFSSRKSPRPVLVYPGEQFGLEWVDYKPHRRTVMIVHGFMSYSNASWVHDMTSAFLKWADVNVIAVDWSRGGNTWKYWRAVANTRRVGYDVTGFLRRLIAETGARLKDFHFVGHSLGAHIASYVSYHIGRVARITGLDPAQPCFEEASAVERLDPTDADFVDIIHTNGRYLEKIGLGFPDPIGHADFYPNGGMKQPGCVNLTRSFWSKMQPAIARRLQQSICSHGRSYLLFTESLINNNCTFSAFRWDLTYEGVNVSLGAACEPPASCAEMGINAIGGGRRPQAKGNYFVITKERQPFCAAVTEWQRHGPQPDLLQDLRLGYNLDRSMRPNVTQAYGDPLPLTTTSASTNQFRKRPVG